MDLNDLKERISKLRRYLDIPGKEESLALLEEKTASPDFWSDSQEATRVQREMKSLKDWIEEWQYLHSEINDAVELEEMAREEKDEVALKEIVQSVTVLDSRVKALELRKMLGEPDDEKPAILSIHPGAGGTESQDWSQMLFRMYTRYFERNNMKYTIIDDEPGDEAGIKSVSIEINGEYVFGFLKSEIGVHRLVRISPFDSNARRHTSFAAVGVYPIVEDVEYDLDEKEIKVDTFRASGAGGQHVNKTDSAVRMTHLPTGIVVSCQSQRSQHKNRSSAMKMLKARVYQKYKQDDEEKEASKQGTKLKIEWGSQIRSYFLHPYNLVKDLRTKYETSNAKAVLDGDIEGFIQAYLLSKVEEAGEIT
ncbi:MAG: peptide chain release factor 2 [Fibrobacteria bacterium]|nr:peptide chain release factor 2 [Fibrobacteria bacterium]